MSVRYQSPNKASASFFLVAFSLMAASSACDSEASKPAGMLEKAKLKSYVIPAADHDAILLNAELALRESLLSATQERVQLHTTRTYGWLSYKKSSLPIQTKVYALRLAFDEVKQRYEATYSGAGISDIPDTHRLEGAGYCGLARDTKGALAWQPVKNPPCFGADCSSQVTSDLMKATCRALNVRVLQHRQSKESV